jgi:hypothetical protein
MVKLHYAELELRGDIKKIKFDNVYKLCGELSNELSNTKDKVYLLSINDNIHVSEHFMLIIHLIITLSEWDDQDIFLQEYNSYESAYKVALDMMEVSHLCYEEE